MAIITTPETLIVGTIREKRIQKYRPVIFSGAFGQIFTEHCKHYVYEYSRYHGSRLGRVTNSILDDDTQDL